MAFAQRVPVILSDPSQLGSQLGYWQNQNVSVLGDEERTRQYWNAVNRQEQNRAEQEARELEALQFNRSLQAEQEKRRQFESNRDFARRLYEFETKQQFDQKLLENEKAERDRQSRYEAALNAINTGAYRRPEELNQPIFAGFTPSERQNMESALRDYWQRKSDEFEVEWNRQKPLRDFTEQNKRALEAMDTARRNAAFAQLSAGKTDPSELARIRQHVASMTQDALPPLSAEEAARIVSLTKMPGVSERVYRFSASGVGIPEPTSATSTQQSRFDKMRDVLRTIPPAYWGVGVPTPNTQPAPIPARIEDRVIGQPYLSPRGIVVQWDGRNWIAPD